MKSIIIKYISLSIFIIIGINVFAQNSTNENCSSFLNSGFVSDGQEYIAKLDENNVAKFYTTFYGGSQYRIIACSNVKDFPLIFSIYDSERNLLFCNKDHNYTPFWNFTFTSTIDCLVEIKFDTDTILKEEVMLLIGFKEK